MKHFIISIIICLSIQTSISASEIDVLLSAHSGQKISVNYYSGYKTDSVTTTLDAQGKGSIIIPDKDYVGMATMFIYGKQQRYELQFIIEKNKQTIQSNQQQLDPATINWHQSPENTYLYTTFAKQSELMRKIEWINFGVNLYNTSSSLYSMLLVEKSQLDIQLKQIEQKLAISPLYAARFMQLVNLLQQLSAPEAKEKRESFAQQMENTVDINALYHSGELWQSLQAFYANLFKTDNGLEDQTNYARSILKTQARLESPYREAFIANSLLITNSLNWKEAYKAILSRVLEANPSLKQTSDPMLASHIRSYQLIGKKAPAVKGLKNLVDKKYNGTLLFFFESDCEHCKLEIPKLIANYSKLKEKGIRVVSIAADLNKNAYYELSKTLPWTNKLCDFEGITGENFSNYDIIGTPTYYYIDNKGNMQGQYFELDQSGLLN